MKKMIVALLVGSILIGIGIGVLLLELGEFSHFEFRQDILQQSQQVYTAEKLDLPKNGRQSVEVAGYLGNYFKQNGTFEVIEDSAVKGGFVADVYYKGNTPRIYSHLENDADYDDMETNYYISANQHNNYKPSDIMDIISYTFENKVFLIDGNDFLIEKIVIRTSDPGRINFDFDYFY